MCVDRCCVSVLVFLIVLPRARVYVCVCDVMRLCVQDLLQGGVRTVIRRAAMSPLPSFAQELAMCVYVSVRSHPPL